MTTLVFFWPKKRRDAHGFFRLDKTIDANVPVQRHG